MKKYLIPFLLIIFCISCAKDEEDTTIFYNERLIVNPKGYSPLTALYSFSSSVQVSLAITIVAKTSADKDLLVSFDELKTNWTASIIGLYPDHTNEVIIELMDDNNQLIETKYLSIVTDPLIDDLPEIQINVETATNHNLNYLVNYFGFSQGGNFTPQRPFIMDQQGNIRWFLDFSSHPTLGNLFYDNGLNILQNGNFIMGDGNSGTLYEIDRMGDILNTWSLHGYGFHHHVIEIPNGNFLVTVNDFSKKNCRRCNH